MVEAPESGGGDNGAERICWQCGETFTADLEYCPEDGNQLVELDPSDTKDILVGRVFDYRFRIVRKLGEGGMSRVYSARRLDEDGQVALKVLKADFLRNPEVRKRFMYEARVISNLEHDNAVDLFDFGQAPDGSFYMVMELLEGESLAARLDGGALSYREIFAIVPPVCEVLAEAHEQDVIHRDLKPENIFLTQTREGTPTPKLLDFGIAKHLRSRTMTENDQLWGTPAYMSPEQASGDPVAGTADIYATGVMLYELIAGVLPFRASTAMGFAVKHMHREASSMLEVPGLEDVPRRLDQFVQRMLEKEPSDRPESMEVVARELRGIRETLFDDNLLERVPALQTNYRELEDPSDEEISSDEVPDDTTDAITGDNGNAITDAMARADIEVGSDEMPATPVPGSASSDGEFETPVFDDDISVGTFDWSSDQRLALVGVGVAVLATVVGVGGWWLIGSEGRPESAQREAAGTAGEDAAGEESTGAARPAAIRRRRDSEAETKAAGRGIDVAIGVETHARSVATSIESASDDDQGTAAGNRGNYPANQAPGTSSSEGSGTGGESDNNVDEALESTF